MTVTHTTRFVPVRMARRPSDLLTTARATLARWHETHRQRRQLATLDARLLADLGISHAAARAEAAKPFWR